MNKNFIKIAEYWDVDGNIDGTCNPVEEYQAYREVFPENSEEASESGVDFSLEDFEDYIDYLKVRALTDACVDFEIDPDARYMNPATGSVALGSEWVSDFLARDRESSELTWEDWRHDRLVEVEASKGVEKL